MTKLESLVFGAICLIMGWVFLILCYPGLSLPFLFLSTLSFINGLRKAKQ